MKHFFSFFILYLFGFSVFAQTNLDKTIMVDGKRRDYIIHLPKNYQALSKPPILVALHGSGGRDENTQRLYRLDAPADKYGYIVVYPQAIYRNWNIPGISAYGQIDSTADDTHFISSLIDSVIRFYKGDSTRVFVTGLSRGGKFSLYLADKLNSKIKAVAPVCASIPNYMEDNYHFNKPMPVLLINGTEDPLVSYKGGYGRLNTGQHTGPGFYMLPTEELVNKLVNLNHCDSTVTITNIPDTDPSDGCKAIKYFYKNDAAPVEFIKIIGGGHTWAGGFQYLPVFAIGNTCKDFSAADEILDFFNLFSH
jgi:polyhydroxybutyrate depolymerase